MDVTEVTEGGTSFLVAGGEEGSRGPARAGQGFYNPAMALTRDLTVLAACAFEPTGRAQFLDGLAAAGARGLRVANEVPGWKVTLNDRARRTARLASRNVERLGLDDRAVARRREFAAIAAEGSWAMIEVDPYGSPAPFLACALRGVRDGGIVAFTATDATALHGVDRRAARRRYLGQPPPRQAPGWKEAASRFLVASIVREAARFDRAAEPLVTHTHQHAFRAYVQVEDGARAADAALESLARVALCPRCYTWGEQACKCGWAQPSGPYYLDDLQDGGFLAELDAGLGETQLAEPDAVATLLDRLQGEAGMRPFYLDVDRAVKARELGGPPPRADLRDELEAQGIATAITHYGPNRLAIDGDLADALSVLAELSGG